MPTQDSAAERVLNNDDKLDGRIVFSEIFRTFAPNINL
jgi:hypothetical protein